MSYTDPWWPYQPSRIPPAYDAPLNWEDRFVGEPAATLMGIPVALHYVPKSMAKQLDDGRKILGYLVEKEPDADWKLKQKIEVMRQTIRQAAGYVDWFCTNANDKKETKMAEEKFHPYMNEMTISIEKEYTKGGTEYIVGTDKKGRRFNVPKAWLDYRKAAPPEDPYEYAVRGVSNKGDGGRPIPYGSLKQAQNGIKNYQKFYVIVRRPKGSSRDWELVPPTS